MHWTFDQDAMITTKHCWPSTLRGPKSPSLTRKPPACWPKPSAWSTPATSWLPTKRPGSTTSRRLDAGHPEPLPPLPADEGLCRHELAAWLARHLAEADPQAEDTDQARLRSAWNPPDPLPAARWAGSARLPLRQKAHLLVESPPLHLPRLLPLPLARDGGCTNPNKKAGRGR